MKNIRTFLLFIPYLLLPLTGYSQPDSCNIPLVGKGRIIDQLYGGTACLLCNSPDLDNIVDGDLSNFAAYNTTVVLLATPIVSIKDITKVYSAGQRAGFVVKPQGGLLDLGLLASFQIKTYLNNTLQETATTSSGLSLNLLGASDGKQRISFVTSSPFDEVELIQVTTLGALTSLRIYYAYTESSTGCDYNCVTEVVTGSPYSPSINNGFTGISGGCLGCFVNGTANVINSNTSDFGRIFMIIGLGAQGAIGVNVGATIPAGYDAGFAIAKNGGGLVDLTVLGSTFIETYLGGAPRESIPFTSLADVSVLGGNTQLISFKTTMSFDAIRLRVNSLASVLVNINVHYAFVRADDDNDGFPNCVDKCAGKDDNLDMDGDGIPNGCDTLDCTLNAGLDQTICPPGITAQLPPAGSGQTWSPVAGNPASATINNSGLIGDMTVDGTYYFQLNGSNGCHDTVAIVRQESALDYACNNPISGFGVTAFDPSNGACLLCVDVALIVDPVLETYVELDANLPIGFSTPIIGVEDTLHDYPGGRRVGFVVQAVGGLVDLSLLSNFEIRTYYHGVLQETATTNNSLLIAGVLPGRGNKQRISFVTTLPFNAVVLVSNALLSTIDYFRVFYAFEEPTTCPDLATENCAISWTVANDYCAGIVDDHTGISGVACVGCTITNIGNAIDDAESTFTNITLTVGIGAQASIAVKTIQTIDGTYEAGFIISGGINLLDATVLGGLQLRTYLNNTPVDNYFASNALIDITLLGNGSDKGYVSFKPTGTFNEIRLTVYGLVNALETTKVYGAFTRKDSDADGTPDCIDKCCLGSDGMDTDGDGAPDACDNSNDPPLAVDDFAILLEDTPITISVLSNDGDPNFDAIHLSEVLAPSNGTVLINGNTIEYTPNANFFGQDTFYYIVCDVFSACDTGRVIITVNPVNDPPNAVNDTVSTTEGTAVIVSVLINDWDVDGYVDTSSLAIITIPNHGNTAIDLNVGEIEYTPVPNYIGLDSFSYVIFDNSIPSLADTATVFIEITASKVRLALKMRLQGSVYNSPDTLMRDDLRANNRIPTHEPYSMLNPLFVHINGGGGEIVVDSAAVFADNGANSIVDWVFIELRDSANPAIVVATRAALLQRDGDVVDVDGTSLLVFENSFPRSYSVAIRHRNHLGVMTESPIALSGTGTQIDFTNLSTPLYDDGTNLNGLEQITIDGKYALWAGNVNGNKTVVFAGQNNDKDPIFNQIDQALGNIFRSQTYVFNGYHLGDVNLNARAVFAGQNNDVDPIFNNVDGHPNNIFHSQTFVIREQLASQ